MEESSLSEMIQFLEPSSRADLQAISLEYIKGLTGTLPGRKILLEQAGIIPAVIKLAPSSRDALRTIVNLSAEEEGARSLLIYEPSVVKTLLTVILDPKSPHADPAAMALSNLSRPEGFAERVMRQVDSAGVTVEKLVELCSNTGYNKSGSHLHYVAPFLSNLSQIESVRKCLLADNLLLLQKLMPFTEFTASDIRRGGIVGIIRNCCFQADSHLLLVSEEADILPRILLPLAGPEEFDDEDNESLPVELQYLPPEKHREVDPDVRKMLLECLQQLCATRACREVLRKRNVYLILRELHKVEKDRAVLLCCENVVDLLIRTEEEIGDNHQDLLKVEVPNELQDKFKKMDEDFIEET